MKKILVAIVAIIIVGLFGGFLINGHSSTINEFENAIDKGNQNIKNYHYEQAVVNFKQALDVKPNDQTALKALQQVQAMQSADVFYGAQHFVTAISQYQTVVDLKQSKVLVQRAHQQLNNNENLLNGAIDLTNVYNQALRLNHAQKYAASTKALQGAFMNGNINNSYFKNITKRINDLRTANAAHKLDRATVTNRLAIRPQTIEQLNNGQSTSN
ncbi:hypothetical protein MOO44_02715 [Nicoliella spurrieriana]|uniref:Tetratricopeptide repeat protein n=1 Tax=Nicoliella spurrieriana TaxID=2925830 RepID=A0A976X5N0_9LACO|nr:hypothetical protein [Nicoliella spurrieriana]UQS87090.1 hypothetical protein MOO44_02715 [Nicoliella spurrieriana]